MNSVKIKEIVFHDDIESDCNGLFLTLENNNPSISLEKIIREGAYTIDIYFILINEENNNLSNPFYFLISGARITGADFHENAICIHFTKPTLNVSPNTDTTTAVQFPIHTKIVVEINGKAIGKVNDDVDTTFTFNRAYPSEKVYSQQISEQEWLCDEEKNVDGPKYSVEFNFQIDDPIYLTNSVHLYSHSRGLFYSLNDSYIEDEWPLFKCYFNLPDNIISTHTDGKGILDVYIGTSAEHVHIGVIYINNDHNTFTGNVKNQLERKYDPVIVNAERFLRNIEDQEEQEIIVEKKKMMYGAVHDIFGVTLKEIYSTDEIRRKEIILSTEEATDEIVESIKKRIHLQSDEKMIANAVETLSHKMTNSLDAKDFLNYLINIVPQKHLNSYDPGKRHARNDRIPYLNLKIVIYDSAAIPSQKAQNITPKLKVALFFAKFVISFDEKSHLIIIEDQEQKDNFLYQTFYDCDIYTVKKNDEIDQFLLELSKFNCSWNSSQFYDEKNSNTGHYVISALKYLKIWDETQLWAKFATNVCERKPLEKYVTVFPDFFHMDSKNKIPATLSSDKAACCPLLTKALNKHIESQSNSPFTYEFSGYSEDPQVESKVAREELDFFCEFLKHCGESYLRNEEEGVHIQRLLMKIIQTNYDQSLSPETLEHLKPLSDKHNQTFHKQMYNFPNFSNLVNPTQESENLEKKTKLIWENMQNNHPNK